MALAVMAAACRVVQDAPRDPGLRAWIPPIPRGPDPLADIQVAEYPAHIAPLPDSVDSRIRRWFNRYTKLLAPSGKPIHLLAQEGVTDAQLLRARKILEHMLQDAPGTRFGADKSAIADSMALRRATLVMFASERDMRRAMESEFGEVELGCQDLRANECPIEGSADYMHHETRDAAFEEILHMVQDYGIRPVLPAFDEEIHRANVAAARAGLWRGWPEDEPENHRNEYLAAVYDNYLDLWTVPPTRYEGEAIGVSDIPRGTSHFGRYGAGSRAAVKEQDPTGFSLIESFFPPYLTYTPVLPDDFEGVFSMRFDKAHPYTWKSQHLVHATLTGRRDASLVGNDWNNRLIGNDGDNGLDAGGGDDVLEGRGGDDRLDGGTGKDRCVYRGSRAEYSVASVEGDTSAQVVTDSVTRRDGVDQLVSIEVLEFADGKVRIEDLQGADSMGTGFHVLPRASGRSRAHSPTRQPSNSIQRSAQGAAADRQSVGRVKT